MSIDRVIHKNSMEHINAYRELLIVNPHGGRSSCSLRGGGAGPHEIFVLNNVNRVFGQNVDSCPFNATPQTDMQQLGLPK